MNILPKKRWHVRTKDNIARVRRDEALAAEEEKKKQMRIEIAEREARTEALRSKARQHYNPQIPVEPPKTQESDASPNKHVNLFYELERNEVVSNKTNEEYEKEKKSEKEKYEKQIGYLTYLGQDTNEITGQVSWYNKPREELREKEEEVSKKQKVFEDPLEDIRKYLGCEGIKKIQVSAKMEKREPKESSSTQKSFDSRSIRKLKRKHKKEKKSKHKKKKKHKKKYSESESEESEESEKEKVKKEGNVDLERLRAERIRREREERKRADELFARLNGVTVKKEETQPETSQRYNSQFNPHIAKQNYINR